MNENGLLTEVITAYLQAIDAGQTPNQDEILARHPELTVDLRQFFATQNRLNKIAEPLQPERPATGQRVGDYEILAEIGRGGMGVVYRARQVSLGRVVALKMLAGGGGEQQGERLQQESRLLAELEHPNIVPVYDVGQQEGRAFFVMKEIEGRNLEEALPELRQDVREGVRILGVVARAVHFAHQKGVLHRDLKPANVLLDEQGTPYVTDFGLARRLENTAALTQTGALVGTPGYMAPEQATGERTLTAAVDVWALGVMLYRLLTGEAPFRGDTPLETLHRIVAGQMRPLGLVGPGADRALEAICLQCLRGNAGDRYQTAAELADDLERWLRRERVSVHGLRRLWSRSMYGTRRALQSRWLRRGPIVATVLLILAGIGYASWVVYHWNSHKVTMDRVEFALNLVDVKLARELFENLPEWPVPWFDDPVRERRERVRHLLQDHLVSLEPPPKDWDFPTAQDKAGREFVSPDGTLVLLKTHVGHEVIFHAVLAPYDGPQPAFGPASGGSNCYFLIPREDLPKYSLPEKKCNFFELGIKEFRGGEVRKIYGFDPHLLRIFQVPESLGWAFWSENGKQVTFGNGSDRIYPRREDTAQRMTYDLDARCWVRFVDRRPGVWIPPATPDERVYSWPPALRLCKDLGELEAPVYFRSIHSKYWPEEFKVGVSLDGTRAWLQCPGQKHANVWRMPGAPR